MQLFHTVLLTQHISKFVCIYPQTFHILQLKFKLKKESLDFVGINLLKIYEEILNMALDADFQKWSQTVWYMDH